jgi:type IX secretion system PorP/SprF family membrane protein
MKWLSLFLLLLLNYSKGSVSAQNIHFSQAYGAHLTLNPANTGRFNGDWRLSFMHRRQGIELSNDYQTSYLGFEHPVYIKEQKLDLGFFYSRDNSSLNTFPVDRFNILVAHGLMLSYRLRMHIGLQGAFVLKQIDPERISFPDQYNRDLGGFDPTLPTNEIFEKEQLSYADLGWGVLLSYQIKPGVVSGGYSTQQLNRPTESFLGIDYQLPFRHVGHLKADLKLTDPLFLIPSIVLIKQQKAGETLIGLNLGYQLNQWLTERNSVIAGIHFRNSIDKPSRSYIVSAGFSWQYWSLMASYDSKISINKTSHRYGNALELGLVYKLPSTQLTHHIIPCERY